MRSLICWIPAIVAFILLFIYSKEKVLLNVYLPVLLLLPQKFHAQTVGFPKLSFAEATIIPIFIFSLYSIMLKWKFSFTDLLVVMFVLWKFCAEFYNSDFGFALNKTATALCVNFGPYMLAKGLMKGRDFHDAFSRKFVLFLFIDVLLSYIEVLSSKNLHVDILSFLFFPGNYSEPVIRYGITRIAGPFDNSLFYGLGIGIALLLHTWLIKNGKWKGCFTLIPGIKKSTIIGVVLISGLILTLSRGPIISFILFFFLMKAGFSKRMMLSLMFRSLVLLLALGVLMFIYSKYSTVPIEGLSSDTEFNVAYRWNLLSVYDELIDAGGWFGWGTSVSLQAPYNSIDNAYLLLVLNYGYGAFAIFVAMILWTSVRLAIKTLHLSSAFLEERSWRVTLLSIIGHMALCFVIVYVGGQPEVLFFIFMGMAENIIRSRPKLPDQLGVSHAVS